MQLSLRALEGLESKYKSAKAKVDTIRQEAKDTVMQVVRSSEIAGTAFGLGVINGRWGRPELLGVPVDLLTAVGAHGLGFALGDEAGPHLHAVGDGAIASYVSTVGVGIGAKMLQESQAAKQLPTAP